MENATIAAASAACRCIRLRCVSWKNISRPVNRCRAGRLPPLVTRAAIRGDLHCHTHASDGSQSIEAMVAAAQQRGYEYLAITDHSQALAIANGLDAAEMRQHLAKIRAYGVCLEINAQPQRLDLSDSYCRQARACGVKMALNTDAHHSRDLALLDQALFIARRAWLRNADVINTLSGAQLAQQLHNSRRAA